MKQEPERSLPDLLVGSEYVCSSPDHYRQANFLGQAIAVVVHTKKDNVEQYIKDNWFKLFEAEREQVSQFRQNTNKFHKQHPSQPGHRNLSIEDDLKFYWNRIQQWLKQALFGKIDWHELYDLIGIQPLIFRTGGTKWWDDVKSVCMRVETTTDKTFSPINEIKKISEGYCGAQKQIEEVPQTPAKQKTKQVNIKRRNRKVSSELTKKETEAYQLVRVSGKTPKQAAIEMQCSPQNVSKLLRKAEVKVNAQNSRSVNLDKAKPLPKDRRGQENISEDDTL
jgi:DNA-binding CsgD family transcriptional regulator